MSVVFAAVCGLIPAGSACAEPRADEAIKIGALMPLTGEFAMAAAAFREGMELAEASLNSAGGVQGKRLRVVVEDTHSDPRLINAAALKLINVEKVIAAMTTSYPETEIGGAQFQKAGIPSLALWDSSPQIDAMGEYIFAIGPWTPSDAEVGAAFCFEKLGARRVAVVNTVEHWSELLSDLFERELKARGGKIVGRFKQNPGDSDFRGVISRLAVLQPDAVYAPLASEVIPFHQQRKAVKLNQPVISAGVISDEHIANAGGALEGVYQSQISDPRRPETAELARRYKARFGRDMSMAWYVATGFDAVRLYAAALQAVGAEPGRIKDYLYTVKEYPGAAQAITITRGGSSPYYVKMFQIRGGKFVEVR